MDNPKKHGAPDDNDGASNKRSKHFHDGPNAIAQGDEEEEKQGSVAAAPAHASPVGRLHNDALGVIFDFLTRAELNRALAVSHSWLAIVRHKMPCVGFGVPCTAASAVEMGSCAFTRHITHIQHTTKVRCKLTSDSLCILALTMPQLIVMRCEIVPSSARKMILPAKLQELELDLSALDAGGINRVVEGIGRLTALSELTLVLPSWFPELSFAPLSKCVALEALTLKGPGTSLWETQPTDAQIDQFRALHPLSCVNIEDLNSSSVEKLLRVPHSLQWTGLGSVGEVDSVGAAALSNFPGIRRLNVWSCRDVSFLPALSRLQMLHLQIQRQPWVVTADTLVESVSSCHQLSHLELLAPVTSNHLTALLPHLPQLQCLILVCCSELESLAFLSAVPSLQLSLRRLEFQRCNHLGLLSSELHHVHTLKQLATLRVVQSFGDPLAEQTQADLTPPSRELPHLTVFEYSYEPPEPAQPAEEADPEAEEADPDDPHMLADEDELEDAEDDPDDPHMQAELDEPADQEDE